MKTALILAYDFPPYISVGAIRPYSWYKYLKEYDIYPVIITRQWSNKYGNNLDYIAPGESNRAKTEETEKGTIVYTPYKPTIANRILLKYGDEKYRFIRRLISAFYEFFQWFFFVGAKSGLYYGAKEYLKNNKVDVIIATGEPFILFKYADKLSKKYEVPWIADYRDVWSQNTFRSFNKYVKMWNKYNERKFLKSVSCVVVVSDFLKIQIIPVIRNKIFFVLPNGYDDDIPDITKDVQQNDSIFSIGFAGTIYKWHPVDSFFEVINKVAKETSHRVNINFYGINNPDDIMDKVRNKYKPLESIINIYPKMENLTLAKELSKNNVLLLFNDYSILGTKIYDYLAVKRCILLCYKNDRKAIELKEKYYPSEKCFEVTNNLQEKLILDTKSGIIVNNSEELLIILKKLIEEHKEDGVAKCDTVNVEKYSRKINTGKLAQIIKERF